MNKYTGVLLVAAVGLINACSRTANVEQDRNSLLALDREASESTTDMDKYLSYYAPNASIYPQGMPAATGVGPIKEFLTAAMSAPGSTVHWTPSKAVVSTSGDVGYTTGAYKFTADGVSEEGKYLTVWMKQPDGKWKVSEDIFNADTGMQTQPSAHVMLTPAAIKWGDPPPALPKGAKLAVLSGDPGKAEPFVLRLQLPAGYKIAAHWHPTDELVTVISGTMAFGMGDKLDEKAAQTAPAGGYALMPARMHHFAMARTAAVVQVHGMGPFMLFYVDPADDPSKQQAK